MIFHDVGPLTAESANATHSHCYFERGKCCTRVFESCLRAQRWYSGRGEISNVFENPACLELNRFHRDCDASSYRDRFRWFLSGHREPRPIRTYRAKRSVDFPIIRFSFLRLSKRPHSRLASLALIFSFSHFFVSLQIGETQWSRAGGVGSRFSGRLIWSFFTFCSYSFFFFIERVCNS